MAHKHLPRTLERLLDQRSEHPERIAQIDERIRAEFEQQCCVLVLDMSGFSRLTIKYGIVHYLAMIRRMHTVVLPIIARFKGKVFKTEADNVFARFEDVPPALDAAVAIVETLRAANEVLPADWDVEVGIGIGHGPLLVVGDRDVWGSEMNLASKLGEDVARPGEILLTDSALARRGRKHRTFIKRKVKLGRLLLPYHTLKMAAPKAKKRSAKPARTKG